MQLLTCTHHRLWRCRTQGVKSRLGEIQARGLMRAGYIKDWMPYSFENERGRLVGFYVEMAYDLARVLGVPLELVPIDRERLFTQLSGRDCDILMSAIAVTPVRASLR